MAGSTAAWLKCIELTRKGVAIVPEITERRATFAVSRGGKTNGVFNGVTVTGRGALRIGWSVSTALYFVGLTDQSFTCTPPHTPRSGAARQLPRLTMHWQKRSATAVTPSHKGRIGASAPAHLTGGVTGATIS
jgi:hypothetical protein